MATTRVRSPCAKPDCPNLATYGNLCLIHYRQMNYADHRERMRRFYASPPWRSLRMSVLTAHPRCQHGMCLERSLDVDHIIPMFLGGAPSIPAICKPSAADITARRPQANGAGTKHPQPQQMIHPSSKASDQKEEQTVDPYKAPNGNGNGDEEEEEEEEEEETTQEGEGEEGEGEGEEETEGEPEGAPTPA